MILDVSHVIVALIAGSAGALLMRKRNERKHTVLFPEPEPLTSETEEKPAFGLRLFQGVFIFGWLIAWTAGIFVVTATLFTGAAGSGGIFLLGWLIAAVAGWVAAVYSLIRVFQGKPLKRFGN